MTAPIYATLTHLREWARDQSLTATDALFARASEVVDEALIGAVYVVTQSTQLPTDSTILQAVRDATCAQVAWFQAGGDTDGTGSATEYESVSIASVSLGKKTGPKATATVLPSGAELAPAALRILRIAGLTSTVVESRG